MLLRTRESIGKNTILVYDIIYMIKAKGVLHQTKKLNSKKLNCCKLIRDKSSQITYTTILNNK